MWLKYACLLRDKNELIIVHVTVNNHTIHDYKLHLTDSTVNNRKVHDC